MKKYPLTPFTDWYRQLPYGGRAALAQAAGIKRSYLSAIANGDKRVGLDVACKLMQANEDITMGMLRPDLFED